MLDMMSNPKKTGGKPAPGKPKRTRGPVLFIQMTEEEEAYLVAFITRQVVEPDRSAVGKKALKKFLQEQGVWPADK